MPDLRNLMKGTLLAAVLFICCGVSSEADKGAGEYAIIREHAISREHPRLLGSKQELKIMAKERSEAYARVVEAARNLEPGDEMVIDDHMKMISMALVSVIEDDLEIGRQAVERAMKYIDAPIRVGHTTFGHDLARCAIVYDLCRPVWSEQEREKFFDYIGKTVDANVNSEAHVFHNGWYGYKHWGYGLAAYATWYEYRRAPEILETLWHDYKTRAAPALEMSGSGGGFAEGYYVNYWSYEWLFFCDVAYRVQGRDFFALAPGFFRNRAEASMFEAYPWMSERNSRRPIPMGDSGGQKLRRERDKALSARRILVNHYRNDPAHQAVHQFNETTPVASIPGNAYKDFLWRDTTVKKGDLDNFKLSHFSPAAGYVYARSSWKDDATHFFFKCGDRFTAHQHLDNGHFLISKHEELAGDGGQYWSFGGNHDINYLLRTIAHSTVRVYDPDETWSNLRAYKGPTGNDGGQTHSWPHHNGAAMDPEDWLKNCNLYDIADITAFEDRGSYLYVAGDCTGSYSQKKLEFFTRQIVYLRPGTFVIFDRVKSTDKNFPKIWQLQAAKPAAGSPPNLVVTNDAGGRLFIQTVLPRRAKVKLNTGEALYSYDGNSYPPQEIRGPAPECRIEVSFSEPSQLDYFLHVLTATDDSVESVPRAQAELTDNWVVLTLGGIKMTFATAGPGGLIEMEGQTHPLAMSLVVE